MKTVKPRTYVSKIVRKEVSSTIKSSVNSNTEGAKNILVIDDSQLHIRAAYQTLTGHNLTTCETYDEGIKLIGEQEWDVVLSDLLMPASGEQQASQEYVGKEMPVGWAIAMYAVTRGVKYIAVGTDADHHNHPASAMLDRFYHHVFNIDGSRVLISQMGLIDLKGTSRECYICGGVGKIYDSWLAKKAGEEQAWRECYACHGSKEVPEEGKNWAALLSRLMKEE